MAVNSVRHGFYIKSLYQRHTIKSMNHQWFTDFRPQQRCLHDDKIITFYARNAISKIILISYDKYNLTFVLLYY